MVALAFSAVDEAFRQARERAMLDPALMHKHENARHAADEAWLALDAHVARHRCALREGNE